MTAAESHPRIEFPLLFYGDASTTKKAWRKLLAAAWTAGGFAAVASEQEVAPVGDLPGELIIDITSYNPKRRESHWWMHWVAIERATPVRNVEFEGGQATLEQAAFLRREQSLILEGMEYLWFAVGHCKWLLARDPWHDYLRIQSRQELDDRFMRQMLAKMVYWLPELVHLSSRVASSFGGYGKGSHFRHAWLRSIIHVATRLGHSGWIGKIWTQEIDTKHGGDPITMLLDHDVIEPIGDRFRVRENGGIVPFTKD